MLSRSFKSLARLIIHTQKNADTQDQKTVQLGSFSQHPARYLAKKSGETLPQELIDVKFVTSTNRDLQSRLWQTANVRFKLRISKKKKKTNKQIKAVQNNSYG